MADLISASNSIMDSKFAGMSQNDFMDMLNGKNQTNTQKSSAKVATKEGDAVAPAPADNPTAGGPSNISVYARGLGASTQSAMSKSNQDVAHVCDISPVVKSAIAKAGAFGAQIVMLLRKAWNELLKFFGVNPASSGFMDYFTKIASWIKSLTEWLKEMNKYVAELLQFIKIIQDVIAFIMSLPAQLMAYFKDCLQVALAALKKGYLDALAAESVDVDADAQKTLDSVNDTINQVETAYNQIRENVDDLTTTAGQTITMVGELSTTVTSVESLVTSGDAAAGQEQLKTMLTDAGYNTQQNTTRGQMA